MTPQDAGVTWEVGGPGPLMDNDGDEHRRMDGKSI